VIHQGDCLEVMAGMEPESVDAIITDPPYGLGFMGREWDVFAPARVARRRETIVRKGTQRTSERWPSKVGKGTQGGGAPIEYDESRRGNAGYQAWCERWAGEMLRLAKPSAYLLAFGGTRTVHRLTAAIEDAGWIIRDMLVWAYASGFPKSKASLKPAWEPIVMARKPGPLRMLAIDECRIGVADDEPNIRTTPSIAAPGMFGVTGHDGTLQQGRWPANIILTDPIFDGGVDGVVGGGTTAQSAPASGPTWEGPSGSASRSPMSGMGDREPQFYGDSGTYSRFFLIPKADRSDREPVLGGLPPDGPRVLNSGSSGRTFRDGEWIETHSEPKRRANSHPTVKPTELMRHLVRLVTPAGGTVLDPFLGSGTTGLAAELEGFPWIGIEKEAEYVAIAEARLNGTQRGMGLVG
jgi:DNA modification methylase